MNKSKESLSKELNNKFIASLAKRRVIKGWIRSASEKYDMPEKISSDFITLRKSLTEADTFTLFILADIVLDTNDVKKYFTQTEIDNLSKSKWHIRKAKIPLEFKMTKINETQYIGKITVSKLMELKEAQLINYNENAQRTMKHIIKGDAEYFQIALNKEAVYAIMESFDSDLYIPNTITLNLPEKAQIKYDEKESILHIKEADYLDILDGYHRYIAMSKIYSQDPNFDYEMELRIVQFPEAKAKRFIWQEDQKTKMRKIDSEAMDSAKISNMIVDRVNNDASFILNGQINRNKGIINAAYLSDCIDLILLKGIKKADERMAIKQITRDIIDAIEAFTDVEPKMIKEQWDKKLIFTLIYEMQYGNIADIKKDYKKIMKDDSIYALPKVRKADITRTSKLLGKGD